MSLITIDFETYYTDKDLGFKTQTTEEYIRDPRFKAFGMGWKWMDGEVESEPEWVSHDELDAFFQSVDWSRTAVLAHNAQFDVAILSWIYGVHPPFIFDSLSMARALRGVEAGNKLEIGRAHV